MTHTISPKQWSLLLLLGGGMFFGTVLYMRSGNSLLSPIAFDHAPLSEIAPALKKKVNTYSLADKTEKYMKTVSTDTEYGETSSYIVTDYDTGAVIAQKDSGKRLPIASLTKIMTAIVALDLASPNDTFTVSRTASQIIPTKIGVKPGEKLSLDELLHAALLTSANDAVEVIKNGINKKYGYDIFVEAMNQKARILGLKDSHFANPQGFDSPLNYSTTRDLAILSHYAMTEYPEIATIVKMDYERLAANHNHRRFDLYNWNGLIGVYPNVFGVKIGNTGDAGTTTIVGAERDGKKVLTVVLGAKGVLQRDLWAAQLLDTGFEKLSGLEPIAVTTQQLQKKYATWKFWN